MASSTRSTEVGAVVGLALALLSCGAAPAPPPVLWAWDRPEDLTFLAPGEAAVAFLAGTVELGPAALFVKARRGSLAVPHGVDRIAVVRIEAPPGTATDPAAAAEVARAIESLVPAEVPSLQIDFDATPSQRPFYRALLERSTRPARELSITALASWCWGDPWIEELPIRFAVPMLYRMGPDGPSIRAGLDRGEDFRASPCRGDLGLLEGEPVPRLPAGRRRWFFSRGGWNRARFDALLATTRALELPSGP